MGCVSGLEVLDSLEQIIPCGADETYSLLMRVVLQQVNDMLDNDPEKYLDFVIELRQKLLAEKVQFITHLDSIDVSALLETLHVEME